MKLRGEPLRPDDNPEVLKQRLAAYRAQTAPLVDLLPGKGTLRTVDGMASIDEVAAAIGRSAGGRGLPRRFRPEKAPAERRQGRASPKPAQEPQGQGAGQRQPPRPKAGGGPQGRLRSGAEAHRRKAARTPQKSRKPRAAEVDEVIGIP